MIEEYNRIFNELIVEFNKRYFGLEADPYIIWEWWRLAPDVVDFDEYFIHINDIYECIKHNIPKEKFFEWYEYSQNKATLNEDGVCDLTSFVMGAIEYTEEDKKKDEDKIEESYKLLRWEIKKTKSKVNRVEVISSKGREYVNMNCEFDEIQYQDNWKTLKLFIK